MKNPLSFPLLGAIIEWTSIGVIVTIYLLIGFLASDVGYNLWLPFDKGTVSRMFTAFGITFLGLVYFIFVLVFEVFSSKPHGLILVRACNISYHIIRWPILLGFAASNNALAITLGFWIEPSIATVAGLGYGFYRCRAPLLRELSDCYSGQA